MANDTFHAEVEAEDAAAERAVLDELEPLYNAKQGVKFWETELKVYDPDASNYGAMGRVRRWLTDHPGDALTDEELGIRARLLSGGRGELYDVANAIKSRAPKLYERLEELGCLQVDGALVRAAIAKGQLTKGDLAGFVRDIDKTPRLVVEKLERK